MIVLFASNYRFLARRYDRVDSFLVLLLVVLIKRNKFDEFCFIINLPCYIVKDANASINKRAQRALGRSPEEKVKGHSGAIYSGPLMLSTNYW